MPFMPAELFADLLARASSLRLSDEFLTKTYADWSKVFGKGNAAPRALGKGGGMDMGMSIGAAAASAKMSEDQGTQKPVPPAKPFGEAVADVYRHFQRDLSSREVIIDPSTGATNPIDKSVKEQVSGELADAITRNTTGSKKSWPVRVGSGFGYGPT